VFALNRPSDPVYDTIDNGPKVLGRVFRADRSADIQADDYLTALVRTGMGVVVLPKVNGHGLDAATETPEDEP
jgi:hypothetical protein